MLWWPGGEGVGLEIQWDLPAQVRTLLAAEVLTQHGHVKCSLKVITASLRKLHTPPPFRHAFKCHIHVKFMPHSRHITSGWPSGLRRCVQVAVWFSRRGFESHF